jgi:hypothetical protein
MSVGLFRKYKLLGAVTFLSLAIPYSSLFGQDCQNYIGVFGGGGDARKVNVRQRGFAFNNINPMDALSVNATGKSGKFASAMVGAHFGREFTTGMWLRPALELEGFYLRACGGKKLAFYLTLHFLSMNLSTLFHCEQSLFLGISS